METGETAYLAPDGFEECLLGELQNITAQYGRLFLTKGPPQEVYWHNNIWLNPILIPISSIGDGVKALRKIQRNWWPYGFRHHRRMELIQQQLPKVSAKPLDFLAPIPSAPLGSWTLLDENTILAASHCSSPMPNGEWQFNEDKTNPPSRAYLKLWEFFTRFGVHPSQHDVCLDLGASPGGWTWVLSRLAKKVVAYDRSPLEPSIMRPNIEFRKEDAFRVKLAEHADARWVFSDVVCYPDKLLELAQKCVAEFPDKNYVFTIKFQGHDHHEVTRRFAAIPNSSVVHLSQNKHELTWFRSIDLGL